MSQKENYTQKTKENLLEMKKTKRRNKNIYFKISISLFITFLVLFISYQFALKFEMPVKYKDYLLNISIPYGKAVDIYVNSLPNYKKFNHVLVKTEDGSYDLYINLTETLLTKLDDDYKDTGSNFLKIRGTSITDVKNNKYQEYEAGADFVIKRIYYVNRLLKGKETEQELINNPKKILILEKAS